MRLNVFHKYLLSYIFIFLIPLLILGVMIYHNVVTNLQNEIAASNMSKLEQVKSLIDEQHKALEHAVAKISADPRLMRYKLQNDGYKRKEAIEELAKYQSNSPLVDDLYLYYRGDRMIYSGLGFSSLNTLTSFQYQFEHWNVEQFIEEINSVDGVIYKPAATVMINRNATKRLMTYMFPVPLHAMFPYGTVIFFIDEQKITDLIGNILGDYEGSVYIFNENHDIMASRDNGAGWQKAELEQTLHSVKQTGVFGLQLGRQEVSAVRTQSDVTGWTFLTVMPTDQFYNRVIERKTFFIYLISILLVTGLGMAILFSRRLSRRIRMAADLTKEYWGQINRQRPFVKEQFLSKLLRGDIEDKQEIEQFIASSQIALTLPNFFVIYIEVHHAQESPLSAGEQNAMWKRVSELELPEGRAFAIRLMSGHSIAMIYNVKDASESAQQRYAEQLVGLFKQAFSIQPVFGVGNIYADSARINRSYVEASAAIEYKIKMGRGVPIYFRDISDYREFAHWYPLKEQYKLTQSLKQGDEAVAQETLADIFANIESQEQSFLLLKCMCFDVINTILKILNELNMREYSDRMKELVEFHSFEELKESLRLLTVEICSRVKRDQAVGKQTLVERIKAYIHEHYKDDQLNLEQVAEQFQLSASYLSRFIKEHLGYTFTNYVIRLRMEEIKRQLIATDKAIKEIIIDAGYTDAPSFTRRFKQMEGITPGEYRSNHKPLELRCTTGQHG